MVAVGGRRPASSAWIGVRRARWPSPATGRPSTRTWPGVEQPVGLDVVPADQRIGQSLVVGRPRILRRPPRSTTASHGVPKSRGESTKWSRLAAKANVATTRTTLVAAPTRVDRVGTPAAPRSRAKRVPATAGGASPSPATQVARPATRRPPARVARTRGRTAIASTVTTTSDGEPPTTSTDSTRMPGIRLGVAGHADGGERRGDHGDATARTAPPAAARRHAGHAEGGPLATGQAEGAEGGEAMASSWSRREMAWPTMTRPMRPATSGEHPQRRHLWADGPLRLVLDARPGLEGDRLSSGTGASTAAGSRRPRRRAAGDERCPSSRRWAGRRPPRRPASPACCPCRNRCRRRPRRTRSRRRRCRARPLAEAVAVERGEGLLLAGGLLHRGEVLEGQDARRVAVAHVQARARRRPRPTRRPRRRRRDRAADPRTSGSAELVARAPVGRRRREPVVELLEGVDGARGRGTRLDPSRPPRPSGGRRRPRWQRALGAVIGVDQDVPRLGVRRAAGRTPCRSAGRPRPRSARRHRPPR